MRGLKPEDQTTGKELGIKKEKYAAIVPKYLHSMNYREYMYSIHNIILVFIKQDCYGILW